MTTVLMVAAVACLLGALFCGRMAYWHGRESRYWAYRATTVHEDPAMALELLRWAHEERPTVWQRLRPWRPPHERRASQWAN